jgi:Protein of unknown function (DUF2924)
MALNIHQEVTALRQMTPKQLRDRHAEVFGEATRCGNKAYLVKRIAWGIQARAEGDISDRAKRRADELAKGTDIRTTMPTPEVPPQGSPDVVERTTAHPVRFSIDTRLPMPGTVLTRRYKDQTIEVTVLSDGFEFGGQKYRSLSAVAKAVTGSHCNGFAFFGLSKPMHKGASP